MNPLDLAKICPEHPDSPLDTFQKGDVYCSSCGRPYHEFILGNLAPVDKYF